MLVFVMCSVCVRALFSLPSSTSSHSVWSATQGSSRLTHSEDPGANKWYRSRASTVAGLTAGDNRRFGAVVAAQPRHEVVVRTVLEDSGTSWPMLTRTNYGEWAVIMKVKLIAPTALKCY